MRNFNQLTRSNLGEEIAKYISHGWNDHEIADALKEPAGGAFELLTMLVGVVRDLMTERTEE
jgi:hypothetical protein